MQVHYLLAPAAALVAATPVFAQDGAERATRSNLVAVRLPDGAFRSTAQDDIETLRQALLKIAQTNHGSIDAVEVLVWSAAAKPMGKLGGALKDAGYNYVTRPAFNAEPGRITPMASVRKDKKDDLIGMWIETPSKMVLLVWGVYRPENAEKPGHPATEPASAKALDDAIQAESADALRALLASGTDANGRTPDGRPLLLAVVAQGNLAAKLEKATALLEAGADPNQGDGDRFTPLVAAALTGNTELMALLVDRGAKVDGLTAKGNTALQVSVAVGRAESVRWLIERGADPDLRPSGGKSAREMAAGNAEIAALLSDKPAPPTRPTTESPAPAPPSKPSPPASGTAPSELRGSWRWTTISGVNYQDRVTGRLAEPSGMSAHFTFLPNGRYKMVFFVRQRTYGLVNEATTTEEGKVTFEAGTFRLHPERGHYKGIASGKPLDREMTAAERKDRTYRWEWRTEGGKRQLYIGPGASSMSRFLRAE